MVCRWEVVLSLRGRGRSVGGGRRPSLALQDLMGHGFLKEALLSSWILVDVLPDMR